MSRQQQDAESSHKSRPRANTTTFTFPSWRRPKSEVAPPVPTAAPVSHLPFEALIEALTPPAVPSLGHARSLANLLATQTPLPRPAILYPVLATLCGNDSPPALQVAGYDIITAYWDNGEAINLGTADRLSYFSLFLGPLVAWSPEIWESRFRALRALSPSGVEVVGMESSLLIVLMTWIDGAFNGLLSYDLLDPAERAERERSIEILTSSMTSVVENVEIVARIPEEELTGVLEFYAELMERALDLPSDFTTRTVLFTTSPTDLQGSTASTPSRAYTHRRHPSSLSLQTLPPISSTPPLKHPADLAIHIYINHLTSQLKVLAPSSLPLILPLLFRALAFYASPLPRISISTKSQESSPLETKITETLTSLLAGPFSTSCIITLKHHLYPPTDPDANLKALIQVSTGAHRTFRNYIRRRLYSRIARAFINRESSINYTPSGAPDHIDLERDLMERAWPKDDIPGWDADRLGRTISRSVEAWVNWDFPHPTDGGDLPMGKEKILDEAAGTLKDVLQELDMREDDGTMDDEEASAVGETLYHLATYVRTIKNADDMPFIIPLSQPTDAPTPFLRTLTSLLARDHTTYLNPLLSITLLCVADHLTDVDTAKLPNVMYEQHDLSPTSPEWLANWENILDNPGLLSQSRPLTRAAIMNSLQAAYESVKDMSSYRMPLADLIFKFCQRQAATDKDDSEGIVMWRILGEEVVLRTVDGQGKQDTEKNSAVEDYITLLTIVALGSDAEDNDTSSVYAAETHSPLPHTPVSAGPFNSPTLSKIQSEYSNKDKDSNLPSVIALLSSLATGNSSRSQSQQPLENEDQPPDHPTAPPVEITILPRSVGAVVALVGIFSQLAFTPYALKNENLDLAARIYDLFVKLVLEAKSSRARLTVLQFMMRTRVDRDHRIYFVDEGYDPDGRTLTLASLIDRTTSTEFTRTPPADAAGDSEFLRRARARVPHERDGRRSSRGRGVTVSKSASSRSRSRAATQHPPRAVSTPAAKPREPIWRLPETLPFTVSDVETPSDSLMSYDPIHEGHRHVLQLSGYLSALVAILDKEKNWEILSYVLCHLPVQLSNKHLFCGPRCRQVLAKLLTTLSAGLINGELASEIDRWPQGLKARDAHGLAYHTVSVLISYQRCFDVRHQHLLVEVLQAGLNGQPNAIKCCLHGLTLSAFELQSSIKKCLSRILEKLSQIMSNPEMAVHILSFLSIIGSLRELHSNFTEGDFKMVFGVALQYLQHYNRPGSSPTISWALSQHLRILSYSIVYVWFLAVKLQDRAHHIPYITRQLLLANEGKESVDEPTEVCFDWLARYTYASADPRPANSLLSEIVMNPTTSQPSELAITEKTWIVGNSLVTIRALARLGWIEILARRPSGCTKFLCRVENVPMVGAGDVDPDTMSMFASLIMERGVTSAPGDSSDDGPQMPTETRRENRLHEEIVRDIFQTGEETEGVPPRPDPITGYVWSGSAPSQRRKHVAIDPAFFALHLSAYPKPSASAEHRIVVDPSLLPSFFRTLDRMPVIDTHKLGVMYVAPGQTQERDILRNVHGSPAYTRFLEGLGRLINLRGQADVYAGGLDPNEDGEYAYAWWDDIEQILFHTATMMPTTKDDPQCDNKKKHIGNDYVRIVWNDSGKRYKFDTLKTQFQFVNIVIEPHSLGTIAAFSNNLHENEYFKVTVQRAPGMIDFTPIGDFKLISAEKLPHLVRELSLLADWFASIFRHTEGDTVREEMSTNWRSRLQAIQRFRDKVPKPSIPEHAEGIFAQEAHRDFTISF